MNFLLSPCSTVSEPLSQGGSERSDEPAHEGSHQQKVNLLFESTLLCRRILLSLYAEKSIYQCNLPYCISIVYPPDKYSCWQFSKYIVRRMRRRRFEQNVASNPFVFLDEFSCSCNNKSLSSNKVQNSGWRSPKKARRLSQRTRRKPRRAYSATA